MRLSETARVMAMPMSRRSWWPYSPMSTPGCLGSMSRRDPTSQITARMAAKPAVWRSERWIGFILHLLRDGFSEDAFGLDQENEDEDEKCDGVFVGAEDGVLM